LVIADLSELNVNAFYELGIRHSASKPAIHMAVDGTKLPFDNLGHRAIFFDRLDWDNISETRRQLLAQAQVALSEDYQPSNPVTQALSAKAFKASAEPNEKVLAELMSRMISLERTHHPEISMLNTSRRRIIINPTHIKEARDIFEDIARQYNFVVEDPHFTNGIKGALNEYTIGYLSDLYDKSRFKQLHDILLENYIPF
jgi:hypothetical protein